MYKQVIVVRKDLKLSPGKLSVQVAHASLGSFLNSDKKLAELWNRLGAKKVVVQVDNQDALLDAWDRAKKLKLPTFLVKDAGLTEIEPGTMTALGIGPAEVEKIDRITGFMTLK